MNLVDRVVGMFSAKAGFERALYRKRQTAMMNYDAATTGRRTYGWKAPFGSANRAAAPGRAQLRNLSRDMIRNRPVAARASEVVVGAVVGTGIHYGVDGRSLKEAGKRAVETVLAEHLQTTRIDAYRERDLFGLQELAMRAIFSDGEVLVRRRWRDTAFEPDLQLPFQIELIEVDCLDSSVFSNGANEVSEGVEYGPTGRVEAYWLFDRHPGELRSASPKSKRVPAQEILHLRITDRPGQTRGVPWLAPVMMTIGELGDYTEAQILKQRMAALFAAIIERDGTFDGAKPDTSSLGALQPGAIIESPEGTKVTFTDPPKVDGYAEFVKVGYRQIAMGIGITYEALSGDLENVNYSSGRMGHMVMDRNVEAWQSQLMIAQFCAGVARWVADAWKVARLPNAGFAMQWTAPRRPLIDPTKEIPALVAEVEGGLSSMQRQQRRLGYDPEVIRRERKEDMEKDKEAGLPTIVGGVGAALAAGAGGDQSNGAKQ